MFHNRISRFSFVDSVETAPEEGRASAFAAAPAFAFAVAGGTNADIYRLAQQQALAQVAARRERARQAHEWN